MTQSLTSGTTSATAGLGFNSVRAFCPLSLLLHMYFSPLSWFLNENHKWVHSHLKDRNCNISKVSMQQHYLIVVFGYLKFHCMYHPKYIYAAWTAHVFPPFRQRAEGCQGVGYFLHITHFLSPIPSMAPWGFRFSSSFLFSRLMKRNPSALQGKE